MFAHIKQQQAHNHNPEFKAHFDRLHSHNSVPQGQALISENQAYYAIVREYTIISNP
jgi:hypothetical protein